MKARASEETRIVAFRMSPKILEMFNNKHLRLKNQAKIRLSKVTVMEMCIAYMKNASFQELMDAYKQNIED